MKKLFNFFPVIIFFLFTANAYSSPEKRLSHILIVGDSLSAGYGIDLEDGWVRLMQKKLDEKLPKKYQVINASISGDTTTMAAGRIAKLLDTYQPNIVIVALGGNDGLQGHPLKVMRKNLSTMVELSQAANAKVLLAGIQIPPNYGQRYTSEFFDSYSLIEKKYSIELVPFILDKIAIDPKLMQQDGIHPTAEAQPQIRDNIWPHLEKLL
ncbi:MAG: arylesterase [Cellvibrionaceae bacterium]